MALSAPSDGELFGRYRLVERIGAGGMAVVYRALANTAEGQSVVVVKRVLPTLSRDPAFVKMLVAEARLSSRLSHPGIVRMHELGRVHDEYFLTMEYVDGIDLLRLLNRCVASRTPMPVGVACLIAQKVASALSYAHALKDAEGRPLEIVHRDISPANIMVTFDGQVKLLDFGVAKAAEHVRDDHTRTGTLKGKINYLSPEQAEGLAIDGRSDLFALGIVLHECLTLKRLFRGSSDLVTLRLVRQADVVPPSHLRADLSTELDTIVLRMLARVREQRFANGDDVAAALAPLVAKHEGTPEQLAEFLRRIGPPAAKPVVEDDDAETETIELGLHDVSPEPAADADVPAVMDSSDGSSVSIIVASDEAPAAPTVDAATTTDTSGEIAAVPQPPQQRHGRALFAGGALVIVAVLVAAVAIRSTPKPALPAAIARPVAPPPIAVPPPPPPAPPTTPAARLDIELDAGKAQIWLDGALVGDGVHHTRVAVDRPGEHVIKVMAPRRQPYRRTVEIVAGKDQEIRIALKRAPNNFEKAKVRTTDGDYLVDPFGPKR